MNLVSAVKETQDVVDRANEVVSRAVLFGGGVAASMLVLSPFLAPVMAHNLAPDVQWVTFIGLLLLLPAASFHIVAAALAGFLSTVGDYGYSAAAYTASSTLALLVSIGGLAVIGPLGAGVGVLCGTVVLAGTHIHRVGSMGVHVRPRIVAFRERAQWRVTAEVITGAALGSALQANLAISLAALNARPGAITAYSYAFFVTSMFLTLSSLPLAIVTLPSLVRTVGRKGRAAAEEHLVKLAPFAFAVVVPLVVGFLFLGRPLVEWVFQPLAGARTAALTFEIGRALAIMTLPATLFYLASAASLPLATPSGRLVAAGATVATQAIAVALAGGDPVAVAWAHAAAMLVSTLLLMAQLLRMRTARVVTNVARSGFPAMLAAAAFPVAALALGRDPSALAAAIAGLVAVGVYALTLRLLAPEVVARFGALLPHAAARA